MDDLHFTSFLTVFRSYQDDGWMTCNFTSFSTVFQSYQDDAWVIMNGFKKDSLKTVGGVDYTNSAS